MQRKAEVPLSDIEQAKAAAKVATLTSAEMQLSEELDDVKKMNQMMLYAKVVTIRDAQAPAAPSPATPPSLPGHPALPSPPYAPSQPALLPSTRRPRSAPAMHREASTHP